MDDETFEALLRNLCNRLDERDRSAFLGLLTDALTVVTRMTPEQFSRLADALKVRAEFMPLVSLARRRLPRRLDWDALGPAAWACVQALIDSGSVTEALEILAAAPDSSEVFGLRGRAYKQLYLSAKPRAGERRLHDHQRALEWYGRGWENRENYWHGVNLAGLYFHASQRAGPQDAAALQTQARETLREVLTAAERGKDAWAAATVAECHIGLELLGEPGHLPAAESALTRYLRAPRTDRFCLQSTLRNWQLLWELGDPRSDEELEGPRGLVANLKRRLLEVEGDIALAPDARWSATATGAGWLMKGVERTRAVGVLRRDGAPVGSATLLTPTRALTCEHVLRGEGPFTVRFQGPESPWRAVQVERRVGRNQGGADAALLVIDPPVSDVKPLLEHIAASPKESGRAYVMGYPAEDRLEISLHGSRIVATNDVRFAYRTAAQEGYSGGPVFDERWCLLGIHQRGDSDFRETSGSWLGANQALLVAPLLKQWGVG